MDVTAALDALRADLPGCSLVAFADLKSKLVLCTSAATKPGQEELDRLSELAEIVLEGSVASGAAPLLEAGAEEARVGSAMLLSGAEARVFLRAASEAPEALVCVCAPDVDLAKVVDCGRSTLDTIVGAT